MSMTSSAAVNTVENLENAGRLVDQHLKADQSFWELSGQLSIATHQIANASGNTDRDYPAVQSYWPALATMPSLGEVNCTPLPPELVQAFENMQCNCAVGLMPLISRAWLTVDRTIYIWSYEDGNDLAYFDGLNEVILSAGLLKPREGVFQEHIEYLLCLTTPVEIVVLGVSFTGVRFYFTTTPNGIPGRPSLLALVHVRLPPGYSPSTTVPKMGNTVQQSFYRKGTLLLSSSLMEERDQLWIVDPDTFPFQPTLLESVVSRPLEGRTWAIAEAIQPGDLEAVASLVPLPPSVVTQHVHPPRRFILLTTQGCYVITRLRPVDQLRGLLEGSRGASGEAVQSFFALHKEEQACAMALILATSPNQQLAFWATEAFFKYGGEPHIVFSGSGAYPPGGGGGGVTTPTPMSPLGQQQSYATPGQGGSLPAHGHPYTTPMMISTPAAGYGSYGSSSQDSTSGALGRAVTGPEVMLSGKHNGLCRYLARLLRPLWNEKVAALYKPPGDMEAEKVVSTYTLDELGAFMEQMYSLKRFIDSNAHQLCTPLVRPGSASPANIHQRVLSYMRPDGLTTSSPTQVQNTLIDKCKADAQAYEQASLLNLCGLVTQCCESLSLWKLVCENELHVVAEGLSQQEKQQLVTTTFRTLIVSSRTLISSVIASLLNRYAGDANMTESLSARLLEIAPSLYSQDDAIASKARELVSVARTIQNREEQLLQLRESVTYFCKVVHKINLPSVCELYKDLKFSPGVVELALCGASSKDRKGLGLQFYKSGQLPQDVNGQAAYIERQQCYSIVTSMLQQLLLTQEQPPKRQSSVPSQPGPPSPVVKQQQQQTSDPVEEFNDLLALCLRSDDELFHVTLYSWMLATPENLADKLVQVRTPYIEPFLKHMATSQDNLLFLNLLWRYYEKNKNYSAAARILDQLANIQSSDLTLDQRVEYISRAVMCAKSCNLATSSSTIGEFLHELEDKMEVARIQLNIVETLRALRPQTANARAAVDMLTKELMDISKLYGDFADPFQLSECKLSIIHCAGHYDPILVESLWTEIVEKEVSLTKKQSVENQMQSMQAKLMQLGQLYIHSERFFPLEHIISVLEKYSCQQHWRVDFVHTTLHRVGVSIQTLFDIYNRLFKSKLPFWQTVHQPLSAIYFLLCHYKDNPSLVPAYERSTFKQTILDAISVYIVELHTATPSSAAGDLHMKFRDLQTHIQGLYMDRDR